MTRWTQEVSDKLEELWLENKLSGREIADRLGPDFTRSMVIARAYRQGLPGRKVGYSGPIKDRARRSPEKKPKSQPKPEVISSKPVIEKIAPSPIVTEFVPPKKVQSPLGAANAVAAIEAGQCHWPHNDPRSKDFHFCGAETDSGEVYCTAHYQRVYQPSRVTMSRHRQVIQGIR